MSTQERNFVVGAIALSTFLLSLQAVVGFLELRSEIKARPVSVVYSYPLPEFGEPKFTTHVEPSPKEPWRDEHCRAGTDPHCHVIGGAVNDARPPAEPRVRL